MQLETRHLFNLSEDTIPFNDKQSRWDLTEEKEEMKKEIQMIQTINTEERRKN